MVRRVLSAFLPILAVSSSIVTLESRADGQFGVFAGTPRSAAELRKAGIGKIAKVRTTEEWLKSTFRIRDAEVAHAIAASIKEYDGPCPCPYNNTIKDYFCGGNSAYSKPGGAHPKCYPADFR